MHVTVCVATSNTPLPCSHRLARYYGKWPNDSNWKNGSTFGNNIGILNNMLTWNILLMNAYECIIISSYKLLNVIW